MGANLKINRAIIRQIPFGLAQGLNGTAARAKSAVETRIDRTFDRPTPFTRRALAVQRASKTKPKATVLIKDRQAAYLFRQELGGLRRPPKRALLVPVGARLNRYGNLSRNQVARLLARPDVFSGTVNGVDGIWQRKKRGGLKLLIAYEPVARYEPRFGFEDTVRATVRNVVAREVAEAMREAIRTARV